MTTQPEKIARLTANMENMAKDVHEIKGIIKDNSASTNDALMRVNDSILQALDSIHKQNENIIRLERDSIEAQKKIKDMQAQVTLESSRITTIEKMVDKYYYKLTGAFAAGGIIAALFGWMLKTAATMKAFM